MQSYLAHLYAKFFTRKILIALIFTTVSALYILNIFLGRNSVSVLMVLNKQSSELTQAIDELSEDNAKLQKMYFEYKNLEQ